MHQPHICWIRPSGVVGVSRRAAQHQIDLIPVDANVLPPGSPCAPEWIRRLLDPEAVSDPAELADELSEMLLRAEFTGRLELLTASALVSTAA